ncbi:phosphonate ABC transporter ATP-binding protein [Methyloferula stellata]|uniref:phosphonate ABC transporter ATP-binding protein n=1 Tax=Methyloferula stellata TaxID=876270 RepID=UPI000368C312|nr:phosphonate ABC transporter ATP-binding protein [Methyloferula stellata]
MLSLNAVSVVYPGERMAIHPTTLAFAPDQFTVILGPSGAGKSTLLRTLNGLVRPSSGAVTVDKLGELVGRLRMRRHRASTAMVFQQHHLIGRISVLRNVLMGRLGYYSTARSLLPLPRRDHLIAMESLDKVGLADVALVRADTLSGGQQQRVGLARALAQQPGLILADEPVASLDPATARRALTLLHDICKRESIAAVVSLHQVDLARDFADRIVGLSRGRVVFDGEPGDLNQQQLDHIYH